MPTLLELPSLVYSLNKVTLVSCLSLRLLYEGGLTPGVATPGGVGSQLRGGGEGGDGQSKDFARAPPHLSRFVSGAHTGPHSRDCWFSLPPAGARPSSQHSLSLCSGATLGGSGAPTFNPEMKEERRAPPKLKTGLMMVPCSKLPGWGLSPTPLSNRPRSVTPALGTPPKPKGSNQLTAYDRVSDSGGGKRGKERARAAPRPHFTPAILRSSCGHAGSLRAARPRPPSTAQPWKAPRASLLPHPRGGEAATQTGSPQGLGPPKASQHSRSEPRASRGVG